MTTQSVEYVSCSRICCGTLPADIIICLPSDLVLSPNCPDTETPEPYERGYIVGELFAERCCGSKCSSKFTYTIKFDDSQLVPGTTLSGDEITGIICHGCLTEWVTDLVGNEIQVEVNEEETEVTITSQHGCETTFSISGSGGSSCNNEIFGFGTDGDFTIPNGEDWLLQLTAVPGVLSSTDIGRAYYFNDLTVEDGAILRPYAFLRNTDKVNRFVYYPIYVNGTLTLNGIISAPDPVAVSALTGPTGFAPTYTIYQTGEFGGGTTVDCFDLGVMAATLESFGSISGLDGPGGGHDWGGPGGGGTWWDGVDVIPGYAGGISSRRGNVFVSESVLQAGDEARYGATFIGSGFAGGGKGGNGGAGSWAGGGIVEEPYHHLRWVPGKLLHSGLVEFNVPDFFYPPNTYYLGNYGMKVIGGGSGGGGGGGGNQTGEGLGGQGGPGGGGGGTIAIYAKNIVIGENGRFRALGGDGYDGADGQATGGGNTADGGGGGAGGGGGLVYIVTESITIPVGSSLSDFFEIDGGAAGLGGAGANGGVSGDPGEAGENGYGYVINLTDCTMTIIHTE